MSKNSRSWRITLSRSVDLEGKLLPHDVSRHGGDGKGRFHPVYGAEREQGSTFPTYLKNGQINQISKIAQQEYNNYLHGKPSNVVEVQEAGGALKLFIVLRKFGIALLGVFVRDHEVATVFPQETSGKNKLGFKGEKYKKSPK